MTIFMRPILAIMFTLAMAQFAWATTVNCTLVKDVEANTLVHRSGDLCDRPASPASTFKIALALIGFEHGFLTAPNAPEIDYDPKENAYYKMWRQRMTPKKWLKFSTIWYSRKITQELGIDVFQDYVDTFDYGNRDLSGDRGQNNGLTHAWLSSSLKISPNDQLEFLERIVERKLPASAKSFRLLDETLETFEMTNGQALKGKTGTAWVLDENGERTKSMQGWFVGWLDHRGRKYVFVRLTTEPPSSKGIASSRTKAGMLAELPALLP